jgi:hypothetical protein
MRSVLLAGLVVGIIVSPTAASAQAITPTPVEASALLDHDEFVRDKLLTIGVGVLIGSVLGSYFIVFRGSMIAGGLAGGLVASWWYGSPETLVVTDHVRLWECDTWIT